MRRRYRSDSEDGGEFVQDALVEARLNAGDVLLVVDQE